MASKLSPKELSEIKTLLPMIRNVYPDLIARDIVGVQPMTAPTGSTFSMRATYNTSLECEFCGKVFCGLSDSLMPIHNAVYPMDITDSTITDYYVMVEKSKNSIKGFYKNILITECNYETKEIFYYFSPYTFDKRTLMSNDLKERIITLYADFYDPSLSGINEDILAVHGIYLYD